MDEDQVQTIPDAKLSSWQNIGRSDNAGSTSSNEDQASINDDEMKGLLGKQKSILDTQKRISKKVVGMLDEQAKKQGLPGIGDKDFQDDFIEIGMIWVEQMAGDPEHREKIMEFLKESPKYTFSIMAAGILGRNVLAGIDNEKKEDSEDNEQA